MMLDRFWRDRDELRTSQGLTLNLLGISCSVSL